MPKFYHQTIHKKHLKHLQYFYIGEKTNPMQQFCQKTKSWNLSVDLEGDKMTVSITYYPLWVVYKQDFTSAKIMKINPKIQLADVFSTFESSKTHLFLKDQQPQVPVSIFQDNRLRTCYYILNGNQIIVHVRTKNDETVILPLSLKYFRKFTQNEIKYFKGYLQKTRIIYERYHPDVNTLSTPSLADDFFFIKTQELIQNTQKQINGDLTQKTNQIMEINNQIKQLADKSSAIGREVLQINENNRQDKLVIENNANNLFKYNTLIPISNAAKLFQINNPYGNRFKIDGLRVHYAFRIQQHITKSPSFFFTYPIEANQTDKVKFRIKGKKTTAFNFGFCAYSKEKGLSQVLYDFMATSVRSGYNPDDEVELYINRSQRTIIYTVNGTILRTSKNELLALYEYSYLPVVQFSQIDQIVEFVVDQFWYK